MMRRAVIVVMVASGIALVGVGPAHAAFNVNVVGATATITGDASVVDQLSIGKSGANLTHDGSDDWDAAPGVQALPDIAGVQVVINAGDGIDIVTVGSPGDTFASTITVNGQGGADFLTVNAGGNGADTATISGNSVAVPGGGYIVWDVTTDQVNLRTGEGADLVNVVGTPTSPQVLVYAGGGDDTLKLANGTSLSSSPGTDSAFRGGPGTDTVDYSAWTTPVSVDLGQNARFEADLSATGTVPPSGSTATGTGFIDFTDLATSTFNYELDASGLDSANITDAHLHNAAGDTILPIGAGATWTDPDTTDPATEVDGTTHAGITEPALRAGTAYFDIHTTAHPAGDIRGQLTLDPDDGYGGSGTGLPRVFTVENLIGGSGNDTFKGSVPHNTFDCGPGQDTVSADATDTLVDCDKGGTGSVSALRPKVKAKGKKLTIDTRAAASCPATAPGSCSVTASATAKVGKKTIKLGTVTATEAAGQSLPIAFKVSKKSAAAWRKAGKLKVTITVAITVPDGTGAAVNKTVKLKVPKHK